jgi:hypothetical protein
VINLIQNRAPLRWWLYTAKLVISARDAGMTA